MERKGLVLIVATAGLAAALATAGAGASAPPVGGAAPEPARAVVDVSVPQLPSGDGEAVRARWHRQRADANGVLSAVAERRGLEIALRIPETGQIAVELKSESVDQLRGRLTADPRVLSVRADRAVSFRYVPDDFAFNRPDPNAPFDDLGQWNLVRSGVLAAWNMSKGTSAEVAVIDSGVDVGHPDLAGRVVGTLDCSPNCSPTPVSDAVGHGTHVSGLACGDSDNAYGIAALGFDCDLWIARVTLCSSVSQAIVAASNRFSDAINLSLGGCDSELAQAIDVAWSQGSVPVAAGTNSPLPGANNYPAERVQPEGSGPDLSAGEGLVVTAAKYSGQRAEFAQRSPGVSVAAYGSASDLSSGGQQGILSTWPSSTTTIDTGTVEPGASPCNCRTSLAGDDRFAYLVGTSMATPQVAGLVALMRSVKPELPAARLVRLIKLTASNCGQYRDGLGWGVIDAHQAVAAALGRDVVPPVSRVRRASSKRLFVKRFERSCSDELPSSGVRKVAIFASANGGPYRRIAKTKGKSVGFRGKPGRRYRFYSVAIDRAGNREAAPASPDTRVRVRRGR